MEMMKDLGGNHVGNRSKPLTKREIETLVNRANGLTLEETARVENVTMHTIKTRLRLAAYKLGSSSTTNTIALALATGIIKDWQVNAGQVPFPLLQEVNAQWVERQAYNVQLGSSVKLRMAELQLSEYGQAPNGTTRLQLSGWLMEPCPALFSIPEVILTRADIPGRVCPTGQRVRVRAVSGGDAYGVGVYVTLRWPKER